MQKKTVGIVAGIACLVLGVFMFIHTKHPAKPGKAEVMAFLDKLSVDIKTENNDTLLTYFLACCQA